MPGRDHEQLLRTSYFRVLIGERELGFAEISPLSSKTDADVPGREHRQQFETVVLRRALTRSATTTGATSRFISSKALMVLSQTPGGSSTPGRAVGPALHSMP
jgi:hypothetical protein